MRFGALAVTFLSIGWLSLWPVDAQNATTTGGLFRGSDWGSSQSEVESREKSAPFHRDESISVFPGTFGDQPAHVIYFFQNDQLVMGFYQLQIEHDDLNDFFGEYDKIKNAISDTLGFPSAENWQFVDKQMEEQHDIWGEALGFGLIKVESGWLTGDSAVALRLSGANFEAHLMVVYTSQDNLNVGRTGFKEYFADQIGVPNPYFRH